jgi:hypothetical protein
LYRAKDDAPIMIINRHKKPIRLFIIPPETKHLPIVFFIIGFLKRDSRGNKENHNKGVTK